MTEAVIRTEALTKHFGPIRALDGLDLAVRHGEIFGFLGPNGSGKSTAIRILLDLIRPTAGTALVFGAHPKEMGPELRARIGYLPGELRMPGHSSGLRYLNYLAGIRGGKGRDQIVPLAERFDLDLTRPIDRLSKGNKQKVGLIQAFMHRPELLILDEPTSGLDPLLQHRFQQLARERTSEGATIFMSSHSLAEIGELADRVGIIRSGRLVDVDDLAAIRHRAGQTVVLRFADAVDQLAFTSLPGVSDVTISGQHGGTTISCTLRGEPDRLLKLAANHRVLEWQAADRDLEDLFLDFYRKDTGAPQPPANLIQTDQPSEGEVVAHV